jgi:hypothetical protein
MRKPPHNRVMAWRQWLLAGSLTAAPLAVAADSLQTTPPAQPGLTTWLPQLRQGDWVKIEGVARPGGGVLAREIKVMHGDFDETEITAVVTSIDANRKFVATNVGVGVEASARTQVHAPKSQGQHGSFSSLQVGEQIEAEGQLQKNGTLLADEIEIKKAKSAQKHDEDELSGRIESVDVEARKIVMLGIAVYFDEQTKNKTPFLD